MGKTEQNPSSNILCRSEPCKYHGWLQFEEWCRHPDHVEPLEPNRTCTMMAAGGKCANFVDWDTKVMPGTEPHWPMTVSIRQLIAVIAVSVKLNDCADWPHI